VEFRHGRQANESAIEELERDVQNYQLMVSLDDLFRIRDDKLFDRSKVVYLLLSYVYAQSPVYH
jgi:hypothetical protein